MATIEVDFDVYKALTMLRPSEDVTYNDVLRQLLNLGQASKAPTNGHTRAGDWTVKGVTFPEGTAFRKTYKGKTYHGEVKNGALHVEGKQFTSPSAAAKDVTGTNLNGWRFWECKRPSDTSWTVIETLWKQQQSHG